LAASAGNPFEGPALTEADAKQASDLPRERFIRESGLDARVATIIEPVIEGLGFRLVRVRLSGQNGLTLQIMAERLDGTMTVEDCENLSRTVAPVLDVADPIDKAYHLEVSSPGIDRPLVSISDFGNWSGHMAKLETSIPVEDRRKFRGRIETVTADAVTIARDNPGYGDAPLVTIPFAAIVEARLLLDDGLIREALRKDRVARDELRKSSRGDDVPDDTEPTTDNR
jgi:ribosome maturation factor RimP